jgi:hypothetical protein
VRPDGHDLPTTASLCKERTKYLMPTFELHPERGLSSSLAGTRAMSITTDIR